MNFKKTFPLITFFVLISILVGCKQPSPIAQNGPNETEPLEPSVSDLQILIATNDLTVGTPRIPIIVQDGRNMTKSVMEITLVVNDLTENLGELVWEGAASNFSDYEIPYWVFYPEIDAAGNYAVTASILLENGETIKHQFIVFIGEEAIAPAVGDAGIPSVSRTAFDAEAIKEISSDFQNVDSDLYQLTIAEALKNGRPTVISFSTPAFCATAFCAPVLNTVKETKPEYTDFDYVHIEIYADFETFEIHQTIQEWRLQSEPWTYVLNADGIVTGRFGGPVSPSELANHLSQVRSQ